MAEYDGRALTNAVFPYPGPQAPPIPQQHYQLFTPVPPAGFSLCSCDWLGPMVRFQEHQKDALEEQQVWDKIGALAEKQGNANVRLKAELEGLKQAMELTVQKTAHLEEILTQLLDGRLESSMGEEVTGALARAEAMRAGHPSWWLVTRWPIESDDVDPA